MCIKSQNLSKECQKQPPLEKQECSQRMTGLQSLYYWFTLRAAESESMQACMFSGSPFQVQSPLHTLVKLLKKNIALSTFIAFGSSNEYFCWEPFLYSFKWSPDALVAGECIAAITTVHTFHSAWTVHSAWPIIVDPQPRSRSPTTVSCVWVEPPAFGGGGDMSGEAAGEKERKKSQCWAEQDHIAAFLDRWKSTDFWDRWRSTDFWEDLSWIYLGVRWLAIGSCSACEETFITFTK